MVTSIQAYQAATSTLERDLKDFEDSLRSGFAETPGAVERHVERIAHVILRGYDAALLAGAIAGSALASIQAQDTAIELAASVFLAPDTNGGVEAALGKDRGAGTAGYDIGS